MNKIKALKSEYDIHIHIKITHDIFCQKNFFLTIFFKFRY